MYCYVFISLLSIYVTLPLSVSSHSPHGKTIYYCRLFICTFMSFLKYQVLFMDYFIPKYLTWYVDIFSKKFVIKT